LKNQYQDDIIDLAKDREALQREIAELKASRDVYLEETSALNARNEELAKLGAHYARRAESNIPPPAPVPLPTLEDTTKKSGSFDRPRPSAPGIMSPSSSSLTASSTVITDEGSVSSYRGAEHAHTSKTKVFKWPGSKTAREPTALTMSPPIEVQRSRTSEHTFQQLNIIRFTRCDHCGEKMWGSQYRCTGCNISVHPRCLAHVQAACAQQSPAEEITMKLDPLRMSLLSGTAMPLTIILAPSMFGRDLTEQAQADAKGGPRTVPVIVEKCIAAVEELGVFIGWTPELQHLTILQPWITKAFIVKRVVPASPRRSLNSSRKGITTRSTFWTATVSTIFAQLPRYSRITSGHYQILFSHTLSTNNLCKLRS
jgi:Rho-type GTPase-activating protein 1/2